MYFLVTPFQLTMSHFTTPLFLPPQLYYRNHTCNHHVFHLLFAYLVFRVVSPLLPSPPITSCHLGRKYNDEGQKNPRSLLSDDNNDDINDNTG